MVVVFIFTLEYAANLYVTKPRRKYALGWWGAIDLLAVLPSYITFMQLAQVIDLRQLKVARILRVLRFLRLMRLLKLAKVVVKDIEEIGKKKYGTLKLDLQIYGIAMLSVLVISSTLTYYAEAEAQPEVFSNIPKAMWWAIITMTTVGYGDMYPITFWGRLVAAGTALCGLALFAMLMNVIGKVMIQGLFGSEDNVDGVEETTTPQETTILDQIRQLAELRDAGILTDEEFTSKKTELLGRV
jgi:voltage-gated potassium channel